MSVSGVRTLCLVSALLVFHSVDAAQRTFVSAGSGSDSNSCARNAPCRNFAAAVAVTDPGGEVVVLDSGGYGAVTVGQSVSLISPTGVYAGISTFSGAGITVSATATDVVIVRGIHVNNQGGSAGITFPGGGTLHVENCVINGFSTGVAVNRSGVTASPQLFVRDTTIRNGTGGSLGSAGISLFLAGGSSGFIRAMLSGLKIENIPFGMWAADNAVVSMTDSVISRCGEGVVSSVVTAGVTSQVNIDHSAITDNTADGVYVGDSFVTGGIQFMTISNSLIATNDVNGIVTHPNGTCWVSFTTITGNGTGLNSSAGLVTSVGNNRLFHNATDGAFTGTLAQQ